MDIDESKPSGSPDLDTVDGKLSRPADTVDGKLSDSYNLGKRRLCYIINNEEFDRNLNLSARSGTNEDFRQLIMVFRNLGFEVDQHKNCKANDILNNLKDLSMRSDLKEFSMFVCIILSHGSDGIIYGTDREVKLDRLFGYFKGDKCPGLIGKPKIFFIQACRGDKFDKGVQADGISSSNIEKIPIEADFLIGYSTVPGYYSWRNAARGSWYIQALCEELRTSVKTHEVVQLMVRVNNRVAEQFRSNTSEIRSNDMVQIPSFVCMLRKSLWFTNDHK